MAWAKEFFKDDEYIVGASISKEGSLVLTNQRLLVIQTEGERDSSGRIVRTVPVELTQEIPLELIQAVADIKSYFFNPYKTDMQISTKEKVNVFREVLSLPESPFSDQIKRQMMIRRRELEAKKPSIVIDFSFLQTYIEKGGIVLTTLKCPHCSASIKMPKGGAETVCEHCGSTVYAQDIFEKVKKLME